MFYIHAYYDLLPINDFLRYDFTERKGIMVPVDSIKVIRVLKIPINEFDMQL